MLVDLRASVEYALGRGKPAEGDAKASSKLAPGAKPGLTAKPAAKPVATAKATPGSVKPAATAAAAGASAKGAVVPNAAVKPKSNPAEGDAPEFEVSGTPGWGSDSDEQAGKKK
jgi:hypothetical protein